MHHAWRQKMTDMEIESVLERIEEIDEQIETLQEHPLVSDYRADECLDMARDSLDGAYQDVAGGSEE